MRDPIEGWNSWLMCIELGKSTISINTDDFPIEIDNDFLSITIYCYRSVNW